MYNLSELQSLSFIMLAFLTFLYSCSFILRGTDSHEVCSDITLRMRHARVADSMSDVRCFGIHIYLDVSSAPLVSDYLRESYSSSRLAGFFLAASDAWYS